MGRVDLPEGYPEVFGKYVLVRPMARGGMGELFIAASGETGGFEKLCVVKKVLHTLEDGAVHRRFLDEAKVVVRLNHANLVQVFDAGKVDEEYYLAMELVEGKDLRAVWNRCAQLHRSPSTSRSSWFAKSFAVCTTCTTRWGWTSSTATSLRDRKSVV